MFLNLVAWGFLAGIIHFVIAGILYGNPAIDRMYTTAMKEHAGVRRWDSRARYLVTQFLGTQVEVYLVAIGYYWLRPLLPLSGLGGALMLGLLFAAIRVYSRFWNMWIQSTYPRNLLAVELVNGTLGVLAITAFLELFAR
ncbi:MAG: hypothetical protein HY537_18040 [Deltaproteobacteria bacterium]|nr:hypothetical protein [Deltaproteobacteria bacterium]